MTKPTDDSILDNNGGLALLPPWLRAVAIVGVPGAIALFLVWMGAKEIPRIYSLVEANHQRLVLVMEQQNQSEQRDFEVFKMLQRICTNTARTDDERSRCFDK